MKKVLAIALALAMIFSLAACGGGGSAKNEKKVINYANGSQPEVLDPISSNYAKTSIVMYNIFTGLTHINADGVAELAYADSYTVSDDGLVYTFHIREDAKWSDGSDLNAKDWENGFEFHMRPENAARSYDLKKYVKNAEAYYLGECTWEEVGFHATDDYTLEITLQDPCTYFLDLCCTYIPYKTEKMEGNPDWSKNPETYITNGPFRVTKIVDQQGFYTEKNPYYYNAENVKIDEVNFIWIDDEAVELASYKNGDINVSDNLSKEADETFKSTSEYHAAEKIGCGYLTCNTEHIEKEVRQAMAYALDRETLIDLLGLAYEPATGLVPFGIHWNGKQWRDVANEKDGGPLVTYDVEKAKQILADAGYPNGEGLPTYTYICKNTETAKAQAVQNMFAQVGIDIKIDTYESSVYWDVYDTEDWDIGDDGWTGDYDDPSTNLFLWEEYREVNADGTLKDARWANDIAKQYDALMKSTYPETDNEVRMETMREAEQLIISDMPVIPTFFYTDTFLVKPEITGVVKCYIGHVFFEYADIVQK
ncbi:MAG: peptide ABC transporter substrate-binding protein [Clostridia bacterium]|nr:peptide ABC transporter substrate-binding protein [Clostridia bacterium]